MEPMSQKFHSELPTVTDGLRKAAMLVCKLMVRIANIEVAIPDTPIVLRSLHTSTFDSAHWDCYQAVSGVEATHHIDRDSDTLPSQANILAAVCPSRCA
jgi:hypothetical protein